MKLTARQSEVLELVCEGLDNAQIAKRLGLAIGTVKEHVSVLHGELHTRSRIQILRTALLTGLYSIPGYQGRPVPWQERVR